MSEGLGCATLHCLGGETQTGLKSTETPNVAATVTAAGDMTYPAPSMPPLIPSAITQPTKHAQELSCPSSVYSWQNLERKLTLVCTVASHRESSYPVPELNYMSRVSTLP